MELIGRIVFGLVTFVIAGTIVWPVWNLVMPELFGLPPVTYTQALWLTVLINLLTSWRNL